MEYDMTDEVTQVVVTELNQTYGDMQTDEDGNEKLVAILHESAVERTIAYVRQEELIPAVNAGLLIGNELAILYLIKHLYGILTDHLGVVCVTD